MGSHRLTLIYSDNSGPPAYGSLSARRGGIISLNTLRKNSQSISLKRYLLVEYVNKRFSNLPKFCGLKRSGSWSYNFSRKTSLISVNL